jgi:hypothetical protein
LEPVHNIAEQEKLAFQGVGRSKTIIELSSNKKNVATDENCHRSDLPRPPDF